MLVKKLQLNGPLEPRNTKYESTLGHRSSHPTAPAASRPEAGQEKIQTLCARGLFIPGALTAWSRALQWPHKTLPESSESPQL